jgi:deoxyribodipyrimidine photo-lyase
LNKSVDTSRIRTVNDVPPGSGPVLYWMNRDQRAQDNWALVHAQHLAFEAHQPLVAAYCLPSKPRGGNARQHRFMVQGLARLEAQLRNLNIPFFLLRGDAVTSVMQFVGEHRIGTVVTDFSPLREAQDDLTVLSKRLKVRLFEVDAHNIVPGWTASDKQEWAARTIRPKINRLLSKYLIDIPPVEKHPYGWLGNVPRLDWKKLATPNNGSGGTLLFEPGSDAAEEHLARFLDSRLEYYSDHRNDPNREAVSCLSPYLHAGHLSAQRVALEAQRFDRPVNSQEAFLEELIIRRELSDNFCLYNSEYDSFEGFPKWARKTLDEHRHDPRAYLYSLQQFENAETHDELWNAAQTEMIITGKMHGYMRMYWAKKILQWTVAPEQALEIALYLNDKYELDGNDPNGFTGVAWSIGGVHDRPWFEREIFGKIRYMSYEGCSRKFDVKRYIRTVSQLLEENSR